MSVQEGLRQLAAREARAPFGFEVFEQRQARATARRRAAIWGSALSMSMLSLVGILALVTQPRVDQDSVMAAVEAQDLLLLPATPRSVESRRWWT